MFLRAIPLKNVGGGGGDPPTPKPGGPGGSPQATNRGGGGSAEDPPLFLGLSDACLRGLKCTKRGSL